MAIRHVIDYFKQIEDIYFELKESVADFDRAMKTGIFDEDQYTQAINMVVRAKENYDRVAYIIYLLYTPNKKKKEKRYKKENKNALNYLSENVAHQSQIKEEMEGILQRFRKLVKEVQEDVE